MKKLFKQLLDNSIQRDIFVKSELEKIETGGSILDAGCGDQKYRKYCGNLNYFGQDFGKYIVDDKAMFGTIGLGGLNGYEYGPLDYVGNIWSISESDETFDAILCTEVLEHIPFPVDTIKEFSRLLKPQGKLILTAPSNCLRHMDPFFYSTGFSDRWYELILVKYGFEIESITPIGDYYRWIAVEIFRTIKTNKISSFWLLPAFIYFILKRRTITSQNTLCMGYHVVAKKKT